jgi:hypothetical protein
MVRGVLLALALAGAPLAAVAQSSAETAGARTTALFSSDDVLEVVLRADLRTLLRDRDSTRRVEHEAVVLMLGPGGDTLSVPLTMRTRGHFRRQSANCDTPPLRMRFRGNAARGTPFEGQRALKLVVQCRNRGDFEQFLLREHMVYRTYALLTERTFRTRLLRVRWEDTGGRVRLPEQYAFVIESERDLGQRIGLEPLEQKGATDADLDVEATKLLDVFQYFVGNTDWSIFGLHNIVLYWDRSSSLPIPVAYDFDWTGVVNASYASPDHRLPIRQVRQRLYRGKCQSPEELTETIAHFVARREAIEALWRSAPGLNDRSRQSTIDYFNEFYRVVGNRGQLNREMRTYCREP